MKTKLPILCHKCASERGVAIPAKCSHKAPKAIVTQVITDLCIAINAVEGTVTAEPYIKENERVRKTLYDLLIAKATMMYIGMDMPSDTTVTLKQLDKAIKAAGWDDQHFVEYGLSLTIVSNYAKV